MSAAKPNVREARDRYLAENGLSTEQYDAKRTPAKLFGFRFSVPNTPRHRWAIMLHDLHHAVTGYGTDVVGEAEMSAWECRAGLRPLGLYTASLVLGLALLGLVIAPRRTWRAWRASQGRSLFVDDSPGYDAILALPVAELRRRLGVPEEGLAGPAQP